MILSLPICPVALVARRHRECPRAGTIAIAIAGIFCAAMPISAAAVGLGAITQQSGLGQSLRIVVPVTLGAGEELSSECLKLTGARSGTDGIPDLLFGRISVERTPSGTTLVVTSPRPVNEPVVRLTLQAGCEAVVRREYTLFMDPPAIEAPVVAAALTPREALGLPPPESVPPESRRAAPSQPRAVTRPATRPAGAPSSPSAADTDAPRKSAPAKGRAAPKASPRPPITVAAERPRLSVSGGAPTALTGGATEADRERARQERANAIEAETQVLRQRIVELTAMVERMQQELKAQELAEQAAAANKSAAVVPPEANKSTADVPPEAPKSAVAAGPAPSEAAKPAPATTATAPPLLPTSSWWEDNALLVAAVVGLPLLIAAGLLWRRRRDASEDDRWRTARATAVRSELPTISRASVLRNPSAGLALRGGDTTAPGIYKEGDTRIPEHEPIDALAVSELSHVTEEARVFMALGHTDRAIEVLHEHIKHLPRSMPAAWLMLLDLYHANGNRSEFRRLAEEFHAHFNVETPLWEAFGSEGGVADGIEGFPHIAQQVVEHWRQPGCHAYLERLLYDNREGRRNGFSPSAYSDILMLLQVLDAPSDIDIDEDLVAAGKLDAGPKAASPYAAPADGPITTTGRARKPMPPDPAASRPVQQPIRFEIEAPDSGDKKKS